MSRPSVVTILILLGTIAPGLRAQARGGETRPTPDPLACVATGEGVAAALISRAIAAVKIPSEPGTRLRVKSIQSTLENYQSDRTYPPFFSLFGQMVQWYDPATGVQRIEIQRGSFPGFEVPAHALLIGRKAMWLVRDTNTIAAPDFSAGATERSLNPWAVLSDFRESSDVSVIGRCQYRDYPRIALTRTGPHGPERLLLDAKTFIPVALLRTEPHYLWGQIRVEYVWSNWDRAAAGGLYPLTTFRMVDGETDLSATITDAAVLPVDSSPALSIPDSTLVQSAANTMFLKPANPDTIRVGPNAWLIRNPSYTVAAVLARDTVFVLDATLSEARARQDSVWIGHFFPGKHPVTLVVTDLAWPHVGGVRFWIASGATVVSHRASRAFLERIYSRRWTLAPDALEKHRATARFSFRPVDDSLALAGGELVLHPIDGISSEVALMAWLPGEHFLWASDYIQNLNQPTEYAREVLTATRRIGVVPERFAAEHVRLTSWRVIDSLHRDEPPVTRPQVGTVDGRRIRTGSLLRHGSITRPNAAVQDLGQRTQEITVVTIGGRPTLVSVQAFSTSRGQMVDSSLDDLATLAPIRHSSTGMGRTMRLNFEGGTVRGRYIPDNGTPLSIDQHFSTPPYDSNIFDLVIAALPLAQGYVATIPLYIYEEGGLVWWKATVTGSEPVAMRDGTMAEAWIVDVEDDGRTRARLWITREHPEVAQTTYFISPGVEFTSTSK
ncbi:MAG: hypothetical protein ABI679_15840 [Gemmatimonadota bacterium]